MPMLELQATDGRREERPLVRTKPLTIGAQSFNDVVIVEPGIAPLHCRISWNKTGYEVTAATSVGIEVNGRVVEHQLLQPGDLIRLGSWDLTYRSEAAVAGGGNAAVPPPLTPREPGGREPGQREPVIPASPGRPGVRSDAEPRSAKPVDELSMFEGAVLAEAAAEEPLTAEVILPRSGSDGDRGLRDDGRRGASARFENRFGAAQRPGEQEILRSPLVLGLGGGTLVLLLISAMLWFLMGRESRSRLLAEAENDFQASRYAQAIERIESLLKLNPSTSVRRKADILLDRARIQQELAGAAPNWANAWDRLQGWVKANRNTADYADLQPLIRDYAEQLSFGAVRAAEREANPALLVIATEARTLMERTTDPKAPPAASDSQIRAGMQRAEVAIEKARFRTECLERMTAAVTAQDPLTALAERQRLIDRYPAFLKDTKLQALLRQAIELAQQTVTPQEWDRPAETAATAGRPSATLGAGPESGREPPSSAVERVAVGESRPADLTATRLLSLLPIPHLRARTDVEALGQTVPVVAQDSVYAADIATGEVVWRQPLGEPLAFFPVVLREPTAGLLAFDQRTSQLVVYRMSDGQPRWRQTVTARPIAPPTIVGGTLLVALADQHLVRLDVDTGRLTGALHFSQPLAGSPVAAADGETLWISGDRSVLYTLSVHPLACRTVTFTDHPPGSVVAPLLRMGRLLLQCENTADDAARLRLWDLREPAQPLPQVGETRVSGPVVDPPVLRGTQLVVPSAGERLAAFVVDDEPGRMGLQPVGTYRVQDGYGGPLSLALGSDQQFWMSSSAFRRFQIGADSLKMDASALAVGLTSQPLQRMGETFFVGRRQPWSQAVTLTNHEAARTMSAGASASNPGAAAARELSSGSWRVVVGGAPQALLREASGNLQVLTDQGSLLTLSASRRTTGGIDLQAARELEIPEGHKAPLLIHASHGPRATVTAAGPTSWVWNVTADRPIPTPLKIDAPLQSAALPLEAGLLLPLAGRLRLQPLSGKRSVEDWKRPPQESAEARWADAWVIGGDAALVLDDQRLLRRVQVRSGEIPHLTATPPIELPAPSGVGVRTADGQWLIPTEAGAIVRIDSDTLDRVSTAPLKEPLLGLATGSAEQPVLAWSRRELAVWETVAAGAEPTWSVPLPASVRLLSARWFAERWWLAASDGRLWTITSDQRRLEPVVRLPQSLSKVGLFEWHGELWALACDGTAYCIPSQGGP